MQNNEIILGIRPYTVVEAATLSGDDPKVSVGYLDWLVGKES